MKTDRFQGLCLQRVSGCTQMNTFDSMPPRLRRRLAYSPFNLCPSCVRDVAFMSAAADEEDVIALLEDAIRRCEAL